MSATADLLLGREPLATRPRRSRGSAKMPKASEAQIQRAIIDALRWHSITAVHIPNAGKRSAIAGRRLKGEGMRPGFPDLACYGHSRHALIEVKTDSGRLSDAQQNMHAILRERGATVIVARSVDDALNGLREAGWPLR